VPLSRRILVAEDDPGVRELIRARLSATGYDTHTAHDGGEALERIRNLRPDAVILDINVPVMDGFAVLARLHADSRLRSIPVLVLTARHASEDVKRAVSLGAKGLLGQAVQRRSTDGAGRATVVCAIASAQQQFLPCGRAQRLNHDKRHPR
jgi:CheY-like chemotaxis protein